MSLVAEFLVPTDAFALADALEAVPDVRVEVERLATHSREWVMPFLWASGGDLDDSREATVEDVAEELDVSANSVSQRLRRANDALVRNTLLIDGSGRSA